MLGRTGFTTNTGGGEEAAWLLSELGWSDKTWDTRTSQVAKWLRFCDEDMRNPLPAEEGDVLAYIGFLSIEGRVSDDSLPQYISAVSRYHELHFLPSPTKTPMVRALMKAYGRRLESDGDVREIRVGCPASLIAKVVAAGLTAEDQVDLDACAATVFAFMFQLRAVSINRLRRRDVVIADAIIVASIFRRKGKSIRRPLMLRYSSSDTWTASNPVALIQRWVLSHTDPEAVMTPSLSDALDRSLALVNGNAPAGCCYSSHSPRIGGYNELLGLGFSKEWIMRRLDWESEAMLRVYLDSSIVPTDHSRWFFAHLRSS